MNARFSKPIVSIMMIVLLLLAVAPSAAQEGPTQVGLRPDAPPYALHGPYWVGTREFVVEPDSELPLPLTVWYPVLNPGNSPEAITYAYDPGPTVDSFTVEGHALLEAATDVSGAPYPLVVVSHGNVGYRYIMSYLGEHLASYGFVVIAPDHIGNTAGYGVDPELAGADQAGWAQSTGTTMVTRPGQIQRIIDYAADLNSDGPLAGAIDLGLVAIAGHSYGGYTALVSAGARVDFAPLHEWCESNATNLAVTPMFAFALTCGVVAQFEDINKTQLGITTPQGEAWPAFEVSGVDAIVPLAPFSIFFWSGGTENISVPTLWMTGSADTSVPLAGDHMFPDYAALASSQKALVVFENGDHGLFSNEAGDWEMAVGWYPFFSDRIWDLDRAHDLINHFTTAFLLSTLKDDAEAAAALAPDAVAFPGITYEAAGF